MEDRKANIKSSDMTEDMQREAVDTARRVSYSIVEKLQNITPSRPQ